MDALTEGRVLTPGEAMTPRVDGRTDVVVLEARAVRPGEWVVLCHLPHNTVTPFVTWRAYDTPSGWLTESGTYTATVTRGVESLNERTGR